MKFDLAAFARRPSKRPLVLANIKPTKAQEGDLLALYGKVIAVWRAGQDRIAAEYGRTLAAITTDSASTTGDEIDAVAAEIQRLVIQLTPDLRRWAMQVESAQRSKWVSTIFSATDVDLNTILTAGDVDDTIEASLSWNVSLIRDVSDEIRRKIANAVFTGFQQRKPANDIAREIGEAIGMARARARRIAADQTVKLGSRLNQARQEQAGLTQFVWVHSGKAHPRAWHLARNGKVFKWDDPTLASDLPGFAPFCGCTGRGYVSFEDE